jgi:hypothetical protein
MNPLAMIDMKSKLKGNVQSNKYTNSGFSKVEGNLDDRQISLIKEIIHGDKKAVVENTSAKIMSLDEAVNYIKNGR